MTQDVPAWGTPPVPPARPAEPKRRGCGGCLLALVGVVVWLVVGLLPLGFVDDVAGPLTKVRWPMPAGTDQEVTVPPGSRMYVTAELREAYGVRCGVRDARGAWQPLTRLSVGAGAPDDYDQVRVFEFVAAEPTVRLRCSGDEHTWVDLWRDDDGARRRYTALVDVVRTAWLVTFTALVSSPVVIRRRRRARAANAALGD